MNEALEALLDVLKYNGFELDITEVINYIDTNENDEIIPFPHFLDVYDHDNPIRIFWSVLVMLYGDYGTSPRFGWIEVANKQKCLNELKSWVELHEDYMCLEDVPFCDEDE